MTIIDGEKKYTELKESIKMINIQRSLSDCNGTRNQNYLVRKRTLNHLVKLKK